MVGFILKLIPVGKPKVEDISKLENLASNRVNSDDGSCSSMPVANEESKLTLEKLKYESKLNEGELFLTNEPGSGVS